jgi:LysW-gamma-L-lysine carboxypeptidase
VEDQQFLAQFLSIYSPSGREHEAGEFLVAEMESRGFTAYRDPVGNAIGTIGASAAAAERTIVLLGHMDTVPGVIPVRIEGDHLYGRGAVDAKGPLATFIAAATRASGQLGGARVMVIGAVEEEFHGKGAHYLAENMVAPDCALIGEPGGWDGITLGYKGMLTAEFRCLQPSRHRATGWPTPGEKAVDFWNCLTAYTDTLNQGESWRFHSLDADLRAIHTFGNGLQEGAEMTIGLRLPPGFSLDQLQEKMRSWANGGSEVTFPYGEPPFQAEKNSVIVRRLLRSIRAHGGKPTFKLKTGTSDMNVVGPVWGCPIATYGPGDAAFDHTPNEHIQLTEFAKAVDVLSDVLRSLSAAGRPTSLGESVT